MNQFVNFLNGLWILVYCATISMAFGVQIFEHEEPCPLCYLQRIGMLLVCVGPLLNLHFGVRVSHYGLSILAALFGGFVALRQIALHVCPGFPKFGEPMFGLSLYTWSFITFASSILVVAILLFLYRKSESVRPEKPSLWTKFVTIVYGLIILGNILSSFIDCGIGPCSG